MALGVVEAVTSCLQRLDDDPHRAVVHRRDEAALHDAGELQRRIDSGEHVGPLAGQTFTVKAQLTNGRLAATAGSLLVDERPRRAAAVVSRLDRADAIFVGVTNCAEFALAPLAHNRRYGSTSNPAAPGRTPGGSSAGCAAAVAAGLVPFSVGSDYGGSIRYPAHCTGIVGYRPAVGSVPAGGQVPAAPRGSPRARFSVPGLLTADVATLATVLPVFLGRPVVARPPGRAAWTPAACWPGVHDDVAFAVRRAAEKLGALPIDECGINPLAGADVLFTRIRATDSLEPIATMAACRTEELTAPMRELLVTPPFPIDPQAESAAQAMRITAQRFFRTYPVLICPVASCVAPPEGTNVPFDDVLAPCRAVSLLGPAALSVPAGRDANGVPIGVQLVGRLPEVLWAAQAISEG